MTTASFVLSQPLPAGAFARGGVGLLPARVFEARSLSATAGGAPFAISPCSLAGAMSASVYSIPLNAVILMAAFRLSRDDETSHCQQAHTCIDSDHLCIEEVARKARHWPDSRWRTALVPLRMGLVRAKCELHELGIAYPRYEARVVSGQFATGS